MNKLDNIKIVFIDIDGTLVNKRKRVTMKTRKSIKRLVLAGKYVVLASGRGVYHTIDKSRRALASNIVIASNGAEIYDYKSGECLYKNIIDKDKVSKIWDYCDKHELGIVINNVNHKYINKYLIGSDKEAGILVTSKKEIMHLDFSQIVFVSNDLERIVKAKEYVKGLSLRVSNYSDSFLDEVLSERYRLDIVNSDVSKGTGVEKLLKILDIDAKDSICFGDYLNDLEMFDVCHFGVAMGNACDEIKEKACFVTETNDKNGVALFLNEYL